MCCDSFFASQANILLSLPLFALQAKDLFTLSLIAPQANYVLSLCCFAAQANNLLALFILAPRASHVLLLYALHHRQIKCSHFLFLPHRQIICTFSFPSFIGIIIVWKHRHGLRPKANFLLSIFFPCSTGRSKLKQCKKTKKKHKKTQEYMR